MKNNNNESLIKDLVRFQINTEKRRELKNSLTSRLQQAMAEGLTLESLKTLLTKAGLEGKRQSELLRSMGIKQRESEPRKKAGSLEELEQALNAFLDSLEIDEEKRHLLVGTTWRKMLKEKTNKKAPPLKKIK